MATTEEKKLKPLDLLNSFSAEEYFSKYPEKKAFKIYQKLKDIFGSEINPRTTASKPETMKEWSIRAIKKILQAKGVKI